MKNGFSSAVWYLFLGQKKNDNFQQFVAVLKRKKKSQGLPLGISQHPVKIWALSMTKMVKLIVFGSIESILIVRECA